LEPARRLASDPIKAELRARMRRRRRDLVRAGSAEAAAARLGLKFERRFTGLGDLKTFLSDARAPRTASL